MKVLIGTTNPAKVTRFAEFLRRFIWHDRIHAKTMYRMAIKTFGPEHIPNVFSFK